MTIKRIAPEGMRWVDRGVTAPLGFYATGVRCGVKTEGPDLALVMSRVPAVSYGLFTSNAVKAAPVLVSDPRARSGHARAVVANSGCANCCTGERGLSDAREMASLAAKGMGVPEDETLVASTGVIGAFLPMEKIRPGIQEAVRNLRADGGDIASRAIMTTDTVPKRSAVELTIGGRTIRIGGIAKGVGMIQPNVATMFCFLTTDAALDAPTAERCLRTAVSDTFNCLTVDGDMSTNDTVTLFANGEAGGSPVGEDSESLSRFQATLNAVCLDLTRQIARDGEGATKLVVVRVTGAKTESDARIVSKSIANSNLVKTAFFGNDPNWGRILMAAGKSGVPFDPDATRVELAGRVVFEKGRPAEFDPAEVSRAMAAEELSVLFDMGAGEASATAYTCDFSYDYVRINAEYHT